MQTTITIRNEQYPVVVPEVEIAESYEWTGLSLLAWNRRFVASAVASANQELTPVAALTLCGKLSAFGEGPGSLNAAVGVVMELAGMAAPNGEAAPQDQAKEAADVAA